MNILGIDIGTSAIKAAIVDVPSMQLLSSVAHVAYELDYPTPGAAEVSANHLWQAIVRAVRQATKSQSLAVEGIGLSVLTPALCVLDKNDRPLGSFWIHADRRSRPQAHRVLNEVGARFLSEIGTRPLPGGISALSWACRRETEPMLEKQVHRYLHVNGWAALHFTGNTAFDPANASFTGLFGTLTDQGWSRRWCDYFQVDPKWLPDICDAKTTIGQLRAAIAEEFGLPVNIPVKLGTADTTCGMLAGQVVVGDLYHTVGTTQVLATITHQPQPHAERLTRRFGTGASYLHVSHNPVGGAALEWIHRLCYSDTSTEQFFQQVVPKHLSRVTSVRLEPPFLGGDRLQIDEALAGFQQLTWSHSRDDLLAAVLTAMRTHHETAVSALGQSADFQRVVLSGGGAEIVRQLIPSYHQSNIEILHEGAVRGAAGLFVST